MPALSHSVVRVDSETSLTSLSVKKYHFPKSGQMRIEITDGFGYGR